MLNLSKNITKCNFFLFLEGKEVIMLLNLASNFHRNIDEAFVRRVHFIVEFPFPDEKMREKIWKKVFS